MVRPPPFSKIKKTKKQKTIYLLKFRLKNTQEIISVTKRMWIQNPRKLFGKLAKSENAIRTIIRPFRILFINITGTKSVFAGYNYSWRHWREQNEYFPSRSIIKRPYKFSERCISWPNERISIISFLYMN